MQCTAMVVREYLINYFLSPFQVSMPNLYQTLSELHYFSTSMLEHSVKLLSDGKEIRNGSQQSRSGCDL